MTRPLTSIGASRRVPIPWPTPNGTPVLPADLVPAKKIEDALHLAIAVEQGFDMIISWNFRQMVNKKTKFRLPELSIENGYSGKLLVDTPQIFDIGDEDDDLA